MCIFASVVTFGNAGIKMVNVFSLPGGVVSVSLTTTYCQKVDDLMYTFATHVFLEMRNHTIIHTTKNKMRKTSIYLKME